MMPALKWKVPILISYAYYKKDIMTTYLENRSLIDLLIDSGAYVVHVRGKVITLDEYAEFIQSFISGARLRYFTLDVIGDPVLTRKNYDELLVRGLHPIPIFTRGADPDVLDYYYCTSRLVAIGALVGTPEAPGYIRWAMENGVKGRPVHWLGFARDDFLLHYKPESCDASTWVDAAKFGSMILRTMSGLRMYTRDRFTRKKGQPEVRSAIAKLGYDINQFKREQNWHGHRGMLQSISIDSLLWWSYTLWKRFGMRYYFVVTSSSQIEIFLNGYHRLKQRGIVP